MYWIKKNRIQSRNSDMIYIGLLSCESCYNTHTIALARTHSHTHTHTQRRAGALVFILPSAWKFLPVHIHMVPAFLYSGQASPPQKCRPFLSHMFPVTCPTSHLLLTLIPTWQNTKYHCVQSASPPPVANHPYPEHNLHEGRDIVYFTLLSPEPRTTPGT